MIILRTTCMPRSVSQYLQLSFLLVCLLSCGNPSKQQADESPTDSVTLAQNQHLSGEQASSTHQDTELQALVQQSKQVLEKQLIEGATIYNADHELQKDPFTMAELKAFAFEAKNILWHNRQLEWDNEDFARTIKEIFGVSIPVDSSTAYTYVNLFDPCYSKPSYHRNDGIDHRGLFIIKPENFISDFYYLPEIIDYRNDYPEIAEKEARFPDRSTGAAKATKVHIEKWMDLENRHDEYSLSKRRQHNRIRLLYRNRFLLGKDNSCLNWLLQNDTFFMESLVKKIGWTNNEKLLHWAVTVSPFDAKRPDEFGSLFWRKDCRGKVKMHANTFKLLQKHYAPDAEPKIRQVLDHMAEYLDYMMGGGAYSKHTRPDITREQQLEIVANMVYFAEQYKYKKLDNGHRSSDLRMMGRLRYYLSLTENAQESKMLKAQNYFGLPKFKAWWDAADYDEYYIDGEWNGPWGRDNEPLTEQEWRKK